MNRDKYYPNGQLAPQGWRLLAKVAAQLFGACDRATGKVKKDGGTWGFDSLEDFLADLNPAASDLFMYFPGNRTIRLCHYGDFSWNIEGAAKKDIVAFEAEADTIVPAHWLPSPPIPPQKVVVFIGHGRASDWRDLKDHLSDKHDIEVEAYETGSRAGHTIRDVLEDMLETSTLAILVHTPEDELADGSFNSRPNVMHETGLFQGKLGFSRAIVLLKAGTKEFSNLAGIQQIRYTEIRQTFGDVLAWIRREQNA